jgi:hypothetical protein
MNHTTREDFNMRQHTGFTLQWIQQVPYLLPFGQAIADHRRGIRINETGAFIWDTLKTEHSRQDLVNAVLSNYGIPAEQQPEIVRDTEEFLSKLVSYGMITTEDTGTSVRANSASVPTDSASRNSISGNLNQTVVIENSAFLPSDSRTTNSSIHSLRISGLTLSLSCPENLYPQEFAPFESDKTNSADCTVTIHTAPPKDTENGTLLLRNRELFVCERSRDYLFLFPAAPQILEGSVTKDGTAAHFYLRTPVNDALTQDLFHAIRLVFLYLGQLHGLFAIHSASILYHGKAWLFSGHSGMGKSTHTNLWNKYLGTPILNGDLNLMELSTQGAVIHGLPWCGTSGISTTETYPLGGIVLLGRADTDIVETLSDDEKALLVTQRLISPSWTAEQLSQNLAFTSALTARIPVCRLKCTKSTAAVETMRQWIDLQDSLP